MLPLAAFYEARRLLFWSIHGYALFPLRRKCMQTEKPPRSPETALRGKQAAAGCRIANTHTHNAAFDIAPFILYVNAFSLYQSVKQPLSLPVMAKENSVLMLTAAKQPVRAYSAAYCFSISSSVSRSCSMAANSCLQL